HWLLAVMIQDHKIIFAASGGAFNHVGKLVLQGFYLLFSSALGLFRLLDLFFKLIRSFQPRWTLLRRCLTTLLTEDFLLCSQLICGQDCRATCGICFQQLINKLRVLTTGDL